VKPKSTKEIEKEILANCCEIDDKDICVFCGKKYRADHGSDLRPVGSKAEPVMAGRGFDIHDEE
jgi:hypothetical protein